MRTLRAVVWIIYVPATLGGTWLLTRLLFVMVNTLTLGQVDPQQMADHLAHLALPYAIFGALVGYTTASVCLGMRWRRPFVVAAELGSIGAAKTFGLLAVIIRARDYGPLFWVGLLALAIGWLALERRGAWPWRRAIRMLAFAVGVFLVVQNAVFA